VQTATPPYYDKTSQYNHSDILWRLHNKAHVTAEEKAAFLAAHPEAFFGYMVDNNINNVNNTLRHEKGYEQLPYNPDKKQIVGQIQMLFAKNNQSILQDIVNSYVFNPNANNWTTDAELVRNLKTHNVIK